MYILVVLSLPHWKNYPIIKILKKKSLLFSRKRHILLPYLVSSGITPFDIIKLASSSRACESLFTILLDNHLLQKPK